MEVTIEAVVGALRRGTWMVEPMMKVGTPGTAVVAVKRQSTAGNQLAPTASLATTEREAVDNEAR